MRILHTADWHIGKKLHKHGLHLDFQGFIKWLGNIIEEQKVEVLLVSGDVFDLANPSSEARKQYYETLLKLRQLNCKIILTGGNHDSPTMLDAPKEILRELDLHVVGGLPENLEEILIPLTNSSGITEIVVAALPYLRDSDLRSSEDSYTYEDRLEAVRKGIQRIFARAAELCRQIYPGIPAVAMGHLYAAGMETAGSERDIQIGNQAAFDAILFDDYFKYIALGHIHKPQQVKATSPTFYSGSPLRLSFSERKDDKRVLLLDTQNSWNPRSIKIPAFRKLLKIKGTYVEIKEKLGALEEHNSLNTLMEVELLEDDYDVTKIHDLDILTTNFSLPGYEIVKSRASFKNNTKGAGEVFTAQQLEDLKPRDVFLAKLGDKFTGQPREEILSAFNELLEEVRLIHNE